MTNVLLMAAVMVTNHFPTVTNGFDVVTSTNSCRRGQTVEMYLRMAEDLRHGPHLGGAVDMTILAVRELHKEVEALREEVKRLREEQSKPAPVQCVPYQGVPFTLPYQGVPFTLPSWFTNGDMFVTGFYFNVKGMIETNYIPLNGGVTP
jgi:uncharacterized small protein (DUF1192 family)